MNNFIQKVSLSIALAAGIVLVSGVSVVAHANDFHSHDNHESNDMVQVDNMNHGDHENENQVQNSDDQHNDHACVLSADEFVTDMQNGMISVSPITLTDSVASITVTNHTQCSANLLFGSNKMFVPIGGPNWIDSQESFSRSNAVLAGGATVTMTANLPSCKAQIDAWQDSNPANPFAYTFTQTDLCSSATSADLAITMTVDNAAPHEGDTVHYTVTASALGAATSTGVSATDLLPSGLTFVSATSSVGSYVPSTGVWTVGDLSAGSNATLVITATINAGTAGNVINNSATISEDSSLTDPNTSNNSASAPLTVQSTTTGGGGGGGTPGSNTLTVTVVGLNASDSAMVAIRDLTNSASWNSSFGNNSLPYVLTTNDHYTVTATSTNPNYTIAYSSACAGILGANATCTVTFTPVSTGNPTDSDISIVKTVDNANPAGGATVIYTVTVTAKGPAASTIVSAHDVLPDGLSLVNASTSVGTYDMTSGNWTIGTLAPNAVATMTLKASIDSRLAGQTITNTATVSQLSSLVDPNTANNSSSVTISVQPTGGNGGGGGGGGGGGSEPTAEIAIKKTVDNAYPKAGDTVHFTLTATAIGPSASFGAVATDLLPAGLTFVSASTSAGTYSSTDGTWTIGSITNGASVNLVITATVNANMDGKTIINTATIKESNNVNDPFTTNNTSSVTLSVGGTPTTGGGATGSVSGGGGSNATSTGQILGASTSCGIYLNKYIHPTRQNDPIEVKKLQVFLNKNLGLNLPVDGVYGKATIAAVNQFQVKYHLEVLKPWTNHGLTTADENGTSYVYKTTQRWINLIMCSSLNLPIPQLP